MKPSDRKRLKAYVLRKERFLTSSNIFYFLAFMVLFLPVPQHRKCIKVYALGRGKFATIGLISCLLSPTAFCLPIPEEVRRSLAYGALGFNILTTMLHIHSRNSHLLSRSVHLFLPEETIAELIALKNRRQKQNIPQWKIYCEIVLCEILPLLWAIHIQIRLQNLSLPPSKKRNID